MFLIAGRGKSGKEYENTRHNVGFLTVDKIACEVGVKITKKGFQSLYSLGQFEESKILLLKPQTYMNNSGNALREAKEFYKIDTDKIIVIHDEMDLPLQTIRLKKAGGSAGHNGIKSIVANIGTDEFARVRVGVGKPSGKDNVEHHVLSGFSKEERELLPGVIESAKDSVFEITVSRVSTLRISRLARFYTKKQNRKK